MTSSCEGAVDGLLSFRKGRFEGLELAILDSVRDATDRWKGKPSNDKVTDDGKAEGEVPFVEIGSGIANIIRIQRQMLRTVSARVF